MKASGLLVKVSISRYIILSGTQYVSQIDCFNAEIRPTK